MVIKGRARGGPAALATHLERRDTNEQIHVRELQGVTARDVRGALREMDCMGSGATSVRTLYHAAINTAPGERLSDEQKRRAIERLEKELGFGGQPRIVVEHLKKDREHMHVVFLRIDTDRMVAIPDSHNFRRHEIVARDLEREFGHQHVQGAHIDREDGQARPPRTPGHDEMQQAERSKIPPEEAKKQITQLWHQADSGSAFAASVTAKGWVLAKGDRRDYVLVDHAGEPHSLARRVEGAKAADIKQRLSDLDPSALPTVSEAKAIQRSNAEAVRTKEKDKTPVAAAAAVNLVLLRVEPRPAKSPVAPLEFVQSSSHTVDKGATPRREAQKAKPPQPKPKTSNPRQPGPVKRLYDTAAAAVQRVYKKARSTSEPKVAAIETRRQTHPLKAVQAKAVEEKLPPKLTPAQEAMKQRRADARALDRRQLALTTDRTHTLKHEVPNDRDRSQTRERKHKLSREEVEMLFERQRRQREFSGPSR